MIRRSESTFTKRSLTYNAAESGKLIGYVRLARDTPAVVLPVFVDADDDDDQFFLYQRINDAGEVSEFVADPDLTLEDIIPDTAFDAPPIVSLSRVSVTCI